MNWMRRWPGGFPVFVAEAAGAHFVDVDGIEYVDFCLGDTGAMSGHRTFASLGDLSPARQGLTTMLPTEDAIWVGEELRRRFRMPWWQLAISATDANRFVIRLARFATGRRRILVFNGCYHGTVDETLHVLEGDRVVPRPGNAGPPIDPALTTRIVEFNDIAALERELTHGDVAAVLAEPALTNIGIVHPEPGYHDALRDITRAHGSLLAIDETHTICVGPGGATAAWDLDPDVVVVGKPIGGGIPVAAYGLSDRFAEGVTDALEGPHTDVSGIGGTLTGSALALAAIRDTLSQRFTPADFDHMIPLAEAWTAGVAAAVRGGRLRLVGAGARRPRRVLLRARAEERGRGDRPGRRRARGVHAPLGAEPAHPPHAFPQHGIDGARHDLGRRRPPHRGVRGRARRAVTSSIPH